MTFSKRLSSTRNTCGGSLSVSVFVSVTMAVTVAVSLNVVGGGGGERVRNDAP
jgi:hypothetical protein